MWLPEIFSSISYRLAIIEVERKYGRGCKLETPKLREDRQVVYFLESMYQLWMHTNPQTCEKRAFTHNVLALCFFVLVAANFTRIFFLINTTLAQLGLAHLVFSVTHLVI